MNSRLAMIAGPDAGCRPVGPHQENSRESRNDPETKTTPPGNLATDLQGSEGV